MLRADRCAYLVARDREGLPLAVLPAYLQSRYDPLGVLGGVLEGRPWASGPMLLSHAWHCYDTCLPAVTLSPALANAVCSSLRGLARDWGAAAFGFVNVAAGQRPLLAGLLRGSGLRGARIDTRYRLPLDGLGPAAYVAALGRNARRTMRRYERRALEAGARVETASPHDGLEEVMQMCTLSAGKHGNASYYPAQAVEAFVRVLGATAKVVKLVLDGEVIAASICLRDGARFHSWAGGARYERGDRFSPNYVLLLGEVRAALEEGCAVMEGGRRSDDFKVRCGMRPIPLDAFLGRAG
jgi:hypothetical protein